MHIQKTMQPRGRFPRLNPQSPAVSVRTGRPWLVRGFMVAACAAFFLLYATSAQAAEKQVLRGHVPSAVAGARAVERLPASKHLELVIGLPLRNQDVLNGLLRDLHDPASTNYHQWLTPGQFTERFGPTEEDYEKVVSFAGTNGLKVTGRHSNRMMVTVDAPVVNIEQAFHVALHNFPHPKENRNFYAPDTEPTVDANIPILHVSGLDNFILPYRLGGGLKPVSFGTNPITAYATGSGQGGNFMGNDFRTAYVPGVTNTGVGQFIAIVDVGGPYYMKDVYMYETNAGLSTNIVITNILLSGWSGIPTGTNDDEGEEVLDIDMAISMAPGATILNYEGEAHAVFNQIAVDNKAKQMTLSYGFGIDATIMQIFQQFVAQGQAMSQASGDGGADPDGGLGLTGAPYSTIVGGTSLTTSGAGGPWQSDTTWGGSGGGISGYGIPDWQQGINMSTNLGSTAFRNYPDVSMPGVNIFTVYRNGTVVGGTGGTSASSPLWAGFMALVNQQAASLGKPSVGFVNPAIYALGKGPYTNYTNCFHDITTGNTFNSQNPGRYAAMRGYDLCTGWGSPTGSNTINALAGTGTNDFTFYVANEAFNIVRGGVAATTLTLTRMNGLAGNVNFSISGLPAGVSAVLNPASTATTSLLTLTASNTAPAGTNVVTITGTSGALTHSLTLNLTIAPPIPGALPVSLSPFYNRAGIYTDGRTFSGGLDGVGYALSANLLGSAPSWNGLVFNLGPTNALDVVSCASQTITLPAGNFTTLQMLATAVQGNQPAQTFTVTYTDNSTATFSQGISDWANPQNYAGESRLTVMSYRNNGGGTKDLNTSATVYAYSLTLNQTKTVKSITLPGNANVLILAMVLANEPVTAPLAAYYNRAGMYADGVTFTNPATGGIDGGGAAYSATLLTGSRTWTNTVFSFGPANATNVISATNQIIALPAGNYSILRMLASAVQGNQLSQIFTVTYTDNSTASFSQSLSDWFSPQNYLGESKAVTMGHRNSSDGSLDNRTFYLYGYSFALNSAKTIQSIKLPNNSKVVVTSISLIPNWQPTFTTSPFTLPGITAGQNYAGTIATNATDLNGGSLTFAKVSGPAWLAVAGGGNLSGTPLSGDAGANAFVVSVTDSGGLSNNATMNITVTPAPPLATGISWQGGNFSLSWNGGVGPYQVQMATNLINPIWQNVGGAINTNMLSITPSNDAAYYRILGQ
jgi:hypothetical protein